MFFFYIVVLFINVCNEAVLLANTSTVFRNWNLKQQTYYHSSLQAKNVNQVSVCQSFLNLFSLTSPWQKFKNMSSLLHIAPLLVDQPLTFYAALP